MHTVFLSFSTCSPYLPPQPPFKCSVFQIIKMQEKSMWLSSEQAADKWEGSHLANNYMCCIGLNFWAANKSRQRWVMLRKAVRWTLTGLWWYQCWVLFTKSSVPNRPFRHQHFGVFTISGIQPSRVCSHPWGHESAQSLPHRWEQGRCTTLGFCSLCVLVMWLSSNSQSCPLLNCPWITARKQTGPVQVQQSSSKRTQMGDGGFGRVSSSFFSIIHV